MASVLLLSFSHSWDFSLEQRTCSATSFEMRSSVNLVYYVCTLRTTPTSDPEAYNTRAHQAIKSRVRCMQINSRRHPRKRGDRWRATCPLRNRQKELQIRRVSCCSGDTECTPTENEIADASIDEWDGHTTQVRQFHHFHWMQRVAWKTQANNVAVKLLQVNSFPTVAACAWRERLIMGMERHSKARK